ncbi:uncharacterized protein [Oryctolagus cuniculus]|uniref:uncharacterized protein n=1 Tax=Oryctolagus cuniculus TaxID=9986 RepID=UPI003879ABC3
MCTLLCLRYHVRYRHVSTLTTFPNQTARKEKWQLNTSGNYQCSWAAPETPGGTTWLRHHPTHWLPTPSTLQDSHIRTSKQEPEPRALRPLPESRPRPPAALRGQMRESACPHPPSAPAARGRPESAAPGTAPQAGTARSARPGPAEAGRGRRRAPQAAGGETDPSAAPRTRRPAPASPTTQSQADPLTPGPPPPPPPPPPYLLLAIVDAHPALLDHQGLIKLQEAAGPHEAVHGRR